MVGHQTYTLDSTRLVRDEGSIPSWRNMIDPYTGNLIHSGRPTDGRARLEQWLLKNKIFFTEHTLDNPLKGTRGPWFDRKSNICPK